MLTLAVDQVCRVILKYGAMSLQVWTTHCLSSCWSVRKQWIENSLSDSLFLWLIKLGSKPHNIILLITGLAPPTWILPPEDNGCYEAMVCSTTLKFCACWHCYMRTFEMVQRCWRVSARGINICKTECKANHGTRWTYQTYWTCSYSDCWFTTCS